MSQIAYDPVKDRLAGIIRGNLFLRTLFYFLLDVFFLRSWHIRKAMRSVFRKDAHRKKEWNVLDAGCGFGQYDRFILNAFPNGKIKSVDIKEDYLDDCRGYFGKEIQNGRISFEVQDLLEYKGDGFDFALCVDVLEHIHEDVKVMRNLRESLKPGGHFLMHSPSHLAAHDAGEDDFFVDEHARAGYSREDITQKIKEAGLEPVKVRYTYGKAGHADWVMMIKWPMLLLNKAGFWSVLLLIFWYLLILLPSLLLMAMDVRSSGETGTGIMALARKPESEIST